MGYQSPESGECVYVIISVLKNGTRPPKTPLPIWYGNDIEVYRIRVGNSSTKKAAMGPYTMVTYNICTNTSNTIIQYDEEPTVFSITTLGVEDFFATDV